jgi:trehalose synthase
VVYPAIDPLSDKNQYFRPERLSSILYSAGLAKRPKSFPGEPFPEPAQRLQPDGTFGPADSPDEIGFIRRPIVTQISRWDRLKGFQPLLEGFTKLKSGLADTLDSRDERHRRRLQALRLVMVGPDPASIQDDPEGCGVLKDLCSSYTDLDPEIRKDIVLITLPMSSRSHNALMVNAIQTASSVVVQNSIREGFGLTLTEAMWKGTPVVGSSACGLRQQIQDRVHGRVVSCPEDPNEVACVLRDVLCATDELDFWSRNAQMRVHQEFLIFSQVKKWLEILKKFQPAASPAYARTAGPYASCSVGHLDPDERVHYPVH